MSNFLKFPHIFLLILFLCGIQCRDFRVRNEVELRSAIDQVQPGDEINLIREIGLPRYELRGSFKLTRNGSATAPIYFNGHPNMPFIPYPNSDFSIDLKASHWILKGLVITGEINTRGLSISGHNNYITYCKINSASYGIEINEGRFNKITNTMFFQTGILLIHASNNLVENCDLNQSPCSIAVMWSSGNVIRNNRARLGSEGASHLHFDWGNGHNIIKDNLFEIDELYAGGTPFIIYNDTMGEFDGNRVFDERLGDWNLFWIATNYTFRNNIITTHSSTIRLAGDSIWVKFIGNRIIHLEKKDPESYCIFSDTTKSIFYSEDNICFNGKLTNLV